MNVDRKTTGHDAPIESANDDLLNALGIARSIHRVLSTSPANWSTRIGLYGAWGSGKTSILNLLRPLEEADGALVFSFSAWSVSNESGVIAHFYSVLADRLKHDRVRLPVKQRAKDFMAGLRRFDFVGRWSRTAMEEVVPLPPIAANAVREALAKLGSTASSWAKIGPTDLSAIASLLKGRRVVVFIDDLDRADPLVVPKTLLALRELLDWPGFSFVLAFDRRMIVSALSDYSKSFGEDARGFLEKVIDVPFEVPEPGPKDLKRLAEAAFAACCEIMPTAAIAALLPVLPSHPRRVKLIARMIGAMRSSLARHAVDEIDWLGIGLYSVVREASQPLADWVVSAKTKADDNWALWPLEKDGREKKVVELKSIFRNLLETPNFPLDGERAVGAAVQLMEHWEMRAKEEVHYWVGLLFCEPSVTFSEFRRLIDEFADDGDARVLQTAMRKAAVDSGISESEAAVDFCTVAVAIYGQSLAAMAESETTFEWQNRYEAAMKSLLMLEYLWSQNSNLPLLQACADGPITATFLDLVRKWLPWTFNKGEPELRQREQRLALLAAERCTDPDMLFAETDPFRDFVFNEGHESRQQLIVWRSRLRDSLSSRVVSRLCNRFAEMDGFVPVAVGDDKLGPWLVESAKSPIYTVPEYTKRLVESLKLGNGQADQVKVIVSKNARLFLEQLLFLTRDGSWGGAEDTREIDAQHPKIIETAWEASVAVQVPFRAMSSLRKLRLALLKNGVSPDRLPEPAWLVQGD